MPLIASLKERLEKGREGHSERLQQDSPETQGIVKGPVVWRITHCVERACMLGPGLETHCQKALRLSQDA